MLRHERSGVFGATGSSTGCRRHGGRQRSALASGPRSLLVRSWGGAELLDWNRARFSDAAPRQAMSNRRIRNVSWPRSMFWDRRRWEVSWPRSMFWDRRRWEVSWSQPTSGHRGQHVFCLQEATSNHRRYDVSENHRLRDVCGWQRFGLSARRGRCGLWPYRLFPAVAWADVDREQGRVQPLVWPDRSDPRLNVARPWGSGPQG